MEHTVSTRLAVLGSAVVVVGVLLACKGRSENNTTTVTSATASTPPSTDVNFTITVPKAGAKFDRTQKTSVKFTFQGKTYRDETDQSSSIEVQSADEFRVTKASVDVKKLVKTTQEGTGEEKRSVNPIAGSRWVISKGDDGKLVALNSGPRVSRTPCS